MLLLPRTLARSVRIFAATLAATAVVRAQIPIAIEPSEQALEATGDPDNGASLAVEPREPVAAPAPPAKPELPPAATARRGSIDPREAKVAPGPARADRLKRSVTWSDDAEDDYEEPNIILEGRERTWYGWQTLTADGISTLVFFGAFNDEDSGGDDTNEALAWAGLLGYELAPAIVHFAHRNPGRGFASMGIRLGMPLAGAFLGGAASSGCHGSDCKAAGIGAGFLLGMGGAIAIDAALLAFDYRDSRARRLAAPGFGPLLSLSPQHALLGLRGFL